MANANARALRKSMTRQEVKLWLHLRALRKDGHHFRRQSPLAPYIVDFECRRSRIIIELDGGQHAEEAHARRDMRRDAFLQNGGYRVLRFWNNEIDSEFEGVMQVIMEALVQAATPPGRALRARPPSPEGEG